MTTIIMPHRTEIARRRARNPLAPKLEKHFAHIAPGIQEVDPLDVERVLIDFGDEEDLEALHTSMHNGHEEEEHEEEREEKHERGTGRRGDDMADYWMLTGGKAPLLTPARELRLAKRVEHGDPEAKEELINANVRLVASVARRYLGRGLPLE